jgi:signal transduction histidine kinase
VTALSGVLILAFDYATLSLRRKMGVSRNNQVVLLLVAVTGFIRGYLSYLGLNLVGISQYADLRIRLITSTTTTLLWFTLAIYLVSLHEEFKLQFNTFLRGSFEALSKVEPTQLRKIPSSLAPEIQAIESRIQEVLGRTYGSVISAETLISVSQQLRDCIETSIRPLSHRLWIQAGRIYPKVSLGPLLREALNRQRFSLSYSMSFISLLLSFNLATSIGFSRALIAIIISWIVCFIFFHLQRKFIQDFNGILLILKIVNINAPGLILSLFFFLINKYAYNDDLGIYNLVLIPTCLSVFLIGSAIHILREDQNLLFQRLKSDMDSRINQSSAKSDRESSKQVAAFLHNSVQSELLALSYQLEELSKDPESDQTKSILEKLASSLSSQISTNFEKFNEKPMERIKLLKTAWTGIAEIELQSEDAELADFNGAHEVVQVIEEAITNAVRSANATHIQISWEKLTGDEFIVTVTDNGMRSSEGVAGLGTLWLNEIAYGRWARNENEGKSTLSVSFGG